MIRAWRGRALQVSRWIDDGGLARRKQIDVAWCRAHVPPREKTLVVDSRERLATEPLADGSKRFGLKDAQIIFSMSFEQLVAEIRAVRAGANFAARKLRALPYAVPGAAPRKAGHASWADAQRATGLKPALASGSSTVVGTRPHDSQHDASHLSDRTVPRCAWTCHAYQPRIETALAISVLGALGHADRG